MAADPNADVRWMQRALQLAKRGVGRTSPNPPVGCVIVSSDGEGTVLGEGYHRRAGEPHGEAAALLNAKARGSDTRGATAYVTLEPCNHTGRTGPCTEALLAGGIARVVCAHLDPNPKVEGRGVARLREGGVTVEVGLLADECRVVNRAYMKWIRTGRPLVTLKAATSLDGRIATASGDSKWLSNATSRRRAHEERNLSDGILVGVGTVLADDPALTTRLDHPEQRDARRIIVDGNLRTPPTAKAVPGALVFAHGDADPARAKQLVDAGAELVSLAASAGGRIDMAAILDELGRRNLMTLLVEGGGTIHGQLVAAGLADQLMLFVTPRLLGIAARPAFDFLGADTVTASPQLHRVRHTVLVDEQSTLPDVLIEGDFLDDLH